MLVEPLVPILRDPVFKQEHRQLLQVIARSDPSRALEIAEHILTNPEIVASVRSSVALSLVETDVDAALAVAALLASPRDRAQLCLQACDVLAGALAEKKNKLLVEALIQARAEADVGQKVFLVGQIAERWLDLGEGDRGIALLREGESLAVQLPEPGEANQRDNAVHMRGRFAASLARIDGPAALRLIEGFPVGPALDLFRAGVARGLPSACRLQHGDPARTPPKGLIAGTRWHPAD